MFSLSDYETEARRLQVLNQKYAFCLNAMQYIKLRQAGAPADLKYEIMEKKVTGSLEKMINDEFPFTQDEKPGITTPVKQPTKLELL
jgi:hypothetical protein